MTDQVIRQLGKLEKFQWLVDDTCCVNNVVHTRISGKVSDTCVKEALASLYQSYMILQVGVVRYGWSGAGFIHSFNRTLPFRTAEVKESLVFQIIESELRIPLPIKTGPMARCFLLRHAPDRATLVLTFHHIIGDGFTGASLMKCLLELIEKHEKAIAARPSSLPLQMPADAYLAKKMSRTRFLLVSLQIIARHLASQFRYGKPAVPPLDGMSSLKNRKPLITMRELPRKTIDRLSCLARTNNTTVHGALAAAYLKAILVELDPYKTHYIMLLSPVNLRGTIESGIDEMMGNYASLTNAAFEGSIAQPFWDMARNVKTSIQNAIEHGEPYISLNNPFILVNVLGSGTTGKRIYTNRFNASFPKLVGLSNVGIIDMENHFESFGVESLGFATTPSAFNNISSIAASVSNIMTWNFMGVSPLYTREHLNKIADRSVAILLNVIEPGNPV